MPRLAWWTILLAAVPARQGQAAEAPSDPKREPIIIRRCEVDYLRSSRVGVAAAGMATSVLQDCLVREGDFVKKGQVLGRIMDRDVQTERALRQVAASNTLAIRMSEAKRDQALARLKRSETLFRQHRGYVSAEEYTIEQLDAKAAGLDVDEAKLQVEIAKLELEQVEARLSGRQFISPHDGLVVEVLKNEGEALVLSEPVFRVVDIDRMKITGYLNLANCWSVQPNQKVVVTPEIDGADLQIESEQFTGRIVFIDRRIDPLTRTCKVVAEVENRGGLLRSGLEAQMVILPLQHVASTPRPSQSELAGSKPPDSAPGLSSAEVKGNQTPDTDDRRRPSPDSQEKSSLTDSYSSPGYVAK